MPRTPEQTHPSDLGWSLGLVLRAYQDVVGGDLADVPHGARGYRVLREVLAAEHPSQLLLARRLGIDRTVMTYLIDDLESAGLVERRPNPSDRRQRQVIATEAGIEAVAHACERVTAAERAVLAGLTETERARLRALIDKAAGELVGTAGDQDPCATQVS